jgi:hypothetical protein
LRQVLNPPPPYPRCVEPWGFTSYLADTGASIVNQSEPVLVMSGIRKKVVIRTPRAQILSLCHIFDAEGNELVQDVDRDIKYTVLLNKRMPLPSDTLNEEEVSEIISFVGIRRICTNGQVNSKITKNSKVSLIRRKDLSQITLKRLL